MTTHTITTEELEKFTTNNRREILFYLHQLINDVERVSVIFKDGKETVLTVLLDINLFSSVEPSQGAASRDLMRDCGELGGEPNG